MVITHKLSPILGKIPGLIQMDEGGIYHPTINANSANEEDFYGINWFRSSGYLIYCNWLILYVAFCTRPRDAISHCGAFLFIKKIRMGKDYIIQGVVLVRQVLKTG